MIKITKSNDDDNAPGSAKSGGGNVTDTQVILTLLLMGITKLLKKVMIVVEITEELFAQTYTKQENYLLKIG
jgi:hypothetical protein